MEYWQVGRITRGPSGRDESNRSEDGGEGKWFCTSICGFVCECCDFRFHFASCRQCTPLLDIKLTFIPDDFPVFCCNISPGCRSGMVPLHVLTFNDMRGFSLVQFFLGVKLSLSHPRFSLLCSFPISWGKNTHKLPTKPLVTKCNGVSCSPGLDGHFEVCHVDVGLMVICLESIKKSCNLCTEEKKWP